MGFYSFDNVDVQCLAFRRGSDVSQVYLGLIWVGGWVGACVEVLLSDLRTRTLAV